jgi:hypothetical protein
MSKLKWKKAYDGIWSASAERGEYVIRRRLRPPYTTDYYEVEHQTSSGRRLKARPVLSECPTLDEAKVVAQQDHDQQQTA